MRAAEAVPAFFFPEAETPQAAEALYQGVISSMRDLGYQPGERRIFSIDYVHDGEGCYDEVGRPDSQGAGGVVAIFQAGDRYLVITPNGGFLRGLPIVVASGQARLVVDFPSRDDVRPNSLSSLAAGRVG